MSRPKTFVMPKLVDERAEERKATILTLVEAIHRQLGHDPARPPALITETEAATVLHQTPATLQKWRYARSKPLPPRKIGGIVLYLPHDVAAFILTTREGARQ